MVIYKIVNPANYIHTIVHYNFYLAIQAAKILDCYKYKESEYKILNKKCNVCAKKLP